MAEDQHREEHASSGDDEGAPKDSLARVLKKKPWLWLVITVAAGVAGWIIYQHFSGSGSATTAANPATPVDTTGDSGGGSGSGLPLPDDSQEEQLLEQLLSENQQIASELAVPATPPNISIYTGAPGPAPASATGTEVPGNSPQGEAAATTASKGASSVADALAPLAVTGAGASASSAGNALAGLAEHASKTQAKTESSTPKQTAPQHGREISNV